VNVCIYHYMLSQVFALEQLLGSVEKFQGFGLGKSVFGVRLIGTSLS